MPNSSRLTKSYFGKQVERSVNTALEIAERGNVTSGRVVPSTGDQVIHSGRRLDATIMFLDISKFSDRPSWTEAEQENLLRMLALFFTEMIRIVEDYGGVVEKNTGDGLMAYFTKQPGDQTPAQQHAVAAALTMFTAARRIINPIISLSNFTPFEFRICMDHGPVTIAQLGAAKRFNTLVAIGASANIASKMLSFAKPNTILIGAEVKNALPIDWQLNYVTLETNNTGWTYTKSGLPYPFWRYIGNWTDPVK